MDHLVSLAKGGTNHISNRVLSCARCNGDQKREHDWREFLYSKSVSSTQFRRREERILGWVEMNVAARPKVSKAVQRLVRAEQERVILAFDKAVRALREVRSARDQLGS
jgi:HNH endonuclease